MSGDDGNYIRDYYRVPAYRDTKVTIDGRSGRIVGFASHYLRVLFTDATETQVAHPTWHVTYHQEMNQ